MSLNRILYEQCKAKGFAPRDVQIKAIDWLTKHWDSANICKILSLPVGSGKSLIAKTIAEHCKTQNKKCAIITPQNILIDQYVKDFNDLNYLKGKPNYQCKLVQDTCEIGTQLRKTSKEHKCENCPYDKSKQRAYKDNITVFNPISYFILAKTKTDNNKTEKIYDIDTIIVDEVQSLAGMLRELVTIKIWEHDFKWERGVTSSLPKITKALEKHSNELGKLIIRGSEFSVKEKARLLLAQKKVDFIIHQLQTESQYFICEEGEEKFRNTWSKCLTIRPKYVPPNIVRRFFSSAKRIIFMSGTVLPYMWKELGYEKADYIDLPSPIPKERRPIFASSSIELSYRSENKDLIYEDMAAQIKTIVNEYHPNQNGVILLPYNLASELSSYLTEDYFIHMDKRNKKEKINQFLRGERYGIGVFSGAYEGLDLKGDLSRFTIIPKVPYPNLSDKVVNIRMKESRLNYGLETITQIMQASGRSIRDSKDWGYTYILDKNFIKLYSETRSHLPRYFRESLVFSFPSEEHIIYLKELQRAK